MSKYEKQNETFFETKDGWYIFRDLLGDGYGEYLFKEHQHDIEIGDVVCANWIGPLPSYGQKSHVKYFETKKDAIVALNKAA